MHWPDCFVRGSERCQRTGTEYVDQKESRKGGQAQPVSCIIPLDNKNDFARQRASRRGARLDAFQRKFNQEKACIGPPKGLLQHAKGCIEVLLPPIWDLTTFWEDNLSNSGLDE